MGLYPRQLALDLPTGQSAFLWGPRKVGKSTLLAERFPQSARFDLLDTRRTRGPAHRDNRRVALAGLPGTALEGCGNLNTAVGIDLDSPGHVLKAVRIVSQAFSSPQFRHHR